MVCGMILAGTAFMLAGIVQIKVDVSININYACIDIVHNICTLTCCIV